MLFSPEMHANKLAKLGRDSVPGKKSFLSPETLPPPLYSFLFPPAEIDQTCKEEELEEKGEGRKRTSFPGLFSSKKEKKSMETEIESLSFSTVFFTSLI